VIVSISCIILFWIIFWFNPCKITSHVQKNEVMGYKKAKEKQNLNRFLKPQEDE
jgi:hypothetical protein